MKYEVRGKRGCAGGCARGGVHVRGVRVGDACAGVWMNFDIVAY